jgi:hypothetical protein
MEHVEFNTKDMTEMEKAVVAALMMAYGNVNTMMGMSEALRERFGKRAEDIVDRLETSAAYGYATMRKILEDAPEDITKMVEKTIRELEKKVRQKDVEDKTEAVH